VVLNGGEFRAVREDAGVAVRGVSGRTIQEVALDFYAQADRGSVWYYGEFYTAHEGDVEALALAVPIDSRPGPPPAELRKLSRGADRIIRLVGSKRRLRASRTLAGLRAA
jgi:hypothetical protein